MTDPFKDKIARLLKPISKKAPTGRSLIYDSIYDDIRKSRISEEDNLPQGVWERPLKKVNWQQVEDLCFKALTQESKDLQIMVWLSEAWFYLYQLDGLQAGIQGIMGLCESYWETIYPLPREGDIEFRLAPFEWLDDKIVVQLRLFPITSPSDNYVHTYSILDWRNATKLAGLTGQAEQNELQRLKQNGSATLDQFNASRDATPNIYFQNLKQKSQDIVSQIQKMNDVLMKKKVKNSSVFHHIKDELKNIIGFTELVLNKRGISSSAITPLESLKEKIKSFDKKIDSLKNEAPMNVQKASTLKIASREEAYAVLEQVATYLESIEPHSPTPLLIRRAIGWGNMSLTEVLQELLQDKGDLLKIQNLLGNAPKSS
ncbi:MAG: type VI secretion system protein TssA [Janthinobacterium lividum]